MQIAAINFQLPIYRATEPIVRNHSANRALDQQFRMARAPGAGRLRLVATDESGKTHVALLLFLFAGESDLVGVDDDNEIAGIDVRRDKLPSLFRAKDWRL